MVHLVLGNLAFWGGPTFLTGVLVFAIAVLLVVLMLRALERYLFNSWRGFIIEFAKALSGMSTGAVLVEMLNVPLLRILRAFIGESRRSSRHHGGSPHHRGRRSDWFSWFVFMIPRKIREPWAGDLREDRMEMARMGMPRWRIEACTVIQLLVLGGQLLRTLVAEAVDAARRLG